MNKIDRVHLFVKHIDSPSKDRCALHTAMSQSSNAFVRQMTTELLACSYEDTEIAYTESGKPYFVSGVAHLSIAHSSNTVAVAVAPQTVGIDIEVLRPFPPRVSARLFSPDEREYIDHSADAERACFELWTVREAYAKARGDGLGSWLRGFSVVEGGRLISTVEQYEVQTFNRKDYVVSVCACCAIGELAEIC